MITINTNMLFQFNRTKIKTRGPRTPCWVFFLRDSGGLKKKQLIGGYEQQLQNHIK